MKYAELSAFHGATVAIEAGAILAHRSGLVGLLNGLLLAGLGILSATFAAPAAASRLASRRRGRAARRPRLVPSGGI